MNHECTFNQYYSQFVTEKMVNQVVTVFGKENLEKAFNEDKHLNTIQLMRWDNFGSAINNGFLNNQMKECGDYTTLAGLVCISKTAAMIAIGKEI
jgi:hypothetical protein